MNWQWSAFVLGFRCLTSVISFLTHTVTVQIKILYMCFVHLQYAHWSLDSLLKAETVHRNLSESENEWKSQFFQNKGLDLITHTWTT